MLPETGDGLPGAAASEIPIGAFRFHPANGRLTCRSGVPVPLGRRATSLLAILAENIGRDVSPAQLLDRVWPGQIVDPANVAVQISGLRAAIGDSNASIILTVHGRGYRLAMPATGAARPIGNIPHMLGALTGREVELGNVLKRVRRDRLLLISGLSGTGKTRLACAAARLLADDFGDGQWLVPLSGLAIADADALASRIGMALALGGSAGPVPALLERIHNRACLLLLDGAELLGDGALDFIRRLLEACPQAAVLITSHVAHRRLRPCCVRLSPLGVSAADAAQPNGANALFVEAASAAGLNFQPDSGVADAIANICRHLGGVPLGVEIAARASGLLGLNATEQASRDPMRALPGMRRPGPARHQSLGAAMGWAFNLLSGTERRALRLLSDLDDEFSQEEADHALYSDSTIPLAGGLATLQEKSMLERAGDGFSLNPLVRAFAQGLRAPS
ncbi:MULTISPECIES: winged helix-turn-helix domain-containing protein [unclassified Azospirillum]|uniref:winged helix-turn-helix domain-containing protein n=1 Tax=unclassified Azospirillum TaxID=2630922 RepID=UPI000B7577A2|nr:MULTISPECIES: winged helix-turn-helix domain-containing protein [unclassified Azospirillum]SNT04480.1 Transcriptional regulatory protein, C terminal [Azospirillum sp. RU38E]SNT20026.1 Transcriptional regulatory protein, C terminal [Azospirillum sp. RU37A]